MDCGRDDYFNVTPVSGSYLARYWNPTNSAYLTVPTGCAPQDSFASSYPIGGNRGAVKGSNAGCGKETGEPAHAGSLSRSVWWTYTAPSSGLVTVDTFGSAFDTVLAVYTGNTVGALTLVNSNDDTAPGSQSKVAFMATGGQRYRIAVDGWSGTTGAIKLNWKHAASPANDNMADAGGGGGQRCHRRINQRRHARPASRCTGIAVSPPHGGRGRLPAPATFV